MLNIIQVPNTSIGKQMSINPEIYRGKYFYEMVMLTSKEIGYEFEYEEYGGGLIDLPEGTAIQLHSLGHPNIYQKGENAMINFDTNVYARVKVWTEYPRNDESWATVRSEGWLPERHD